MVFSHVKITCYFHMWRNKVFVRKLTNFLITKSPLNLSNTEILHVCVEHVKLQTFLGYCFELLWLVEIFKHKKHPLKIELKFILFEFVDCLFVGLCILFVKNNNNNNLHNIIHGRVTTSDKPVTVGLFGTSLNLRRLLQVVFNPSVTSESTVNGVQWHHYSFALIHAKSKTWFSAGKQRNIVWKCLHDTELLYSFFIGIRV